MVREGDTSTPFWRRLLWFAAIWVGSVLALALVAGALRWVLIPGP
jgi:hypothetical protein